MKPRDGRACCLSPQAGLSMRRLFPEAFQSFSTLPFFGCSSWHSFPRSVFLPHSLQSRQLAAPAVANMLCKVSLPFAFGFCLFVCLSTMQLTSLLAPALKNLPNIIRKHKMQPWSCGPAVCTQLGVFASNDVRMQKRHTHLCLLWTCSE